MIWVKEKASKGVSTRQVATKQIATRQIATITNDSERIVRLVSYTQDAFTVEVMRIPATTVGWRTDTVCLTRSELDAIVEAAKTYESE